MTIILGVALFALGFLSCLVVLILVFTWLSITCGWRRYLRTPTKEEWKEWP